MILKAYQNVKVFPKKEPTLAIMPHKIYKHSGLQNNEQ